MVEGTGLENRRTGNGTVSSNLTLSVKKTSCILHRRSRKHDVGCSLLLGRVAEWFKAHAWKVCVHESVPWVRIPPRPLTNSSSLFARSFPLTSPRFHRREPRQPIQQIPHLVRLEQHIISSRIPNRRELRISHITRP